MIVRSQIYAFICILLPILILAAPHADQNRHVGFPNPFYILVRPHDISHSGGESYLSLQRLPSSKHIASALRSNKDASLFNYNLGALSTQFAHANGSLGDWSSVHLQKHQLMTWEPDRLLQNRPKSNFSIQTDASGAFLSGSYELGSQSWYYCDKKGVAFHVRQRYSGFGPAECYPVYLLATAKGP